MLNSFQHLLGAPAPLKGKFIMDRNLGQRDTNYIESGLGALYYIFGRKDPFGGPGNSLDTPAFIGRGQDNWQIDTSTSAPVTIGIATNNPMKYYTSSSSDNWASGVASENYVWLDYEASVLTNDKSIYDPSPYGWKIMSSGTMDGFTTETMTDWVYVAESSNVGRSYPRGDNPFAYFPPYCHRNSRLGTWPSYGVQSHLWHSTPGSTIASHFFFVSASQVYVSPSGWRTNAMPIRPVQHYEE